MLAGEGINSRAAYVSVGIGAGPIAQQGAGVRIIAIVLGDGINSRAACVSRALDVKSLIGYGAFSRTVPCKLATSPSHI